MIPWPPGADSTVACHQVGELLLSCHERGAQFPRLVGDGGEVALHALHGGVVRHMYLYKALIQSDVVIVDVRRTMIAGSAGCNSRGLSSLVGFDEVLLSLGPCFIHLW